MEKKKINIEKILNKISAEEKFQREKRKLLYYNTTLKESQQKKLMDMIDKSVENVAKLKDKIKNKQKRK